MFRGREWKSATSSLRSSWALGEPGIRGDRSCRGAVSPKVNAILIAVLIAGIAGVGVGFSAPSGESRISGALYACATSSAEHVAPGRTSPSGGTGAARPSLRASEAVPALLGLVNATNWSASGSFCYDWVVAFPAAGLTFGDTQLRVYTALCASVPVGYGISYLDRGGSPIETENLSGLAWSPSPSGLLLAGDSLLVSSTAALSQDQLDTNVTGFAEGSLWHEGTGMAIGSYNGELEGPCL